MGSCNLDVALDAPLTDDGLYRLVQVGQPVSGTITVTVDEPVRCDGLTVRLTLRQRGRNGGPRLCDPRERKMIFSGAWEPGTYCYPFTLPGPDRPGYEGHTFVWSWRVEAEAEIPGAVDASDKLLFVVESPPPRNHDDIIYEPQVITQSGGAGDAELLRKYGIGFLTLPILGMAVVLPISDGWGLMPTDEQKGQLVGLVVVLCWLLNLWMMWKARRRARDLLGPEIEVAIDRPNGNYRSHGVLAAKTRVRGVARRRATSTMIDEVWVELIVTEQNKDGLIRHKLWETDLRLEPAIDGSYPFALPLPAPGTVPFSIGQRGVQWLLRVRVARPDRPEDEFASCVIDARPAS